MGVAADVRLMGTISRNAQYAILCRMYPPSEARTVTCSAALRISGLHSSWQLSSRAYAWGVRSLGLTDLAGPIGKGS